MATCYRHPNRETGVCCSNCGNPICPDCMTPTPVGMRCPDCSRQKTRTRTLQSMAVEPIATYVLIAINVAIFFGAQSSDQATYAATSCSFGPLRRRGRVVAADHRPASCTRRSGTSS